MTGRDDILVKLDRDEIIGSPSYTQISNLGVVQLKHGYDQGLLDLILEKALELKEQYAAKRQLNLRYIRSAHVLIPEINEIARSPLRLERLSRLAQTKIEPYPLSVIASIITFSGTESSPDGAIRWHADGVPATELVPLAMEDLEGGELQLYKGAAEVGLALQEQGQIIPVGSVSSVTHRLGYSVFGQLMRLMHRVGPITRGSRVTLNMNLRSAERPYVDDNSMCYLAADNPDFSWADAYITDVRERQLPAYMEHQS
ncbi:hypothetical protein [Agrobacterium sp. LAD9]|uniref:hypothetical protein n=1 Tax=Agrobacterium sp. LAD9 TaxID=2055153 RepID=UPI000D1EC30D|nr:hypothetical protein [Agrobacterium sp. LAD9]